MPSVVLRRTSLPYLYILGALFLAAVVTSVRHARGRHAMLALAGTTFALLVLEGLVGWQVVGFATPTAPKASDALTAAASRPGFRMEGDYATISSYFETDSLLGYGPRKGVRVTARKLFGDAVIYDVVYSVGSDGLRVIPFDAGGARESLAFFGDSFTYGEGVNDAESFPALVQRAVGQDFRVFNFAFHGYGPHQMLRRMDSGTALQLMGGEPPKHVFYLAIPEHVFRAQSASSWDAEGPRYVIADHELRFAGSFSNHVWAWFHRRLMLSRVYALVASTIVDRRSENSFRAGLPLFAWIVADARRFVENQWHAQFHVLTWCRPWENCATFERWMRTRGIEVTSLRDVLPGFVASYDRFVLAHDKHPSAYAHEQIADLIVRTWLRPAAAAGTAR